MSMMSQLLYRLHIGSEALDQMHDILARAKGAGGAYALSTQERKDVLAVLAPLAGAVNGKIVFSPGVNGAALAAFLQEQHGGGWTGCKDAATAAEVRIRSGNRPLAGADISTLRLVADALTAQCSDLSARTGGY